MISRVNSSMTKMFQHTRLKPLLAIIGPTGTGKSRLAVHIAEQCGGEVINADALQVYRGLPIATNKPTLEEMKNIPHHLFDLLDLNEPTWHVRKFVTAAENVIADIHARGKVPILVGGTHYYIHSLLFNNSPGSIDKTSSADLNVRTWPILEGNSQQMLDELRGLDPDAASWWHPNETQKIRRSLEICLRTGEKVSEIYQRQKLGREDGTLNHIRYEALCLYLHSERGELNARLDDRVDRMMRGGLVDEVRFMREKLLSLKRRGEMVDLSSGIWIAIGYKEFQDVFDALEGNELSSTIENLKKIACERMKIATRQYATRQSRYVKNKLLPLYKDGNFDMLRILDASKPSVWDATVVKPAMDSTMAYLKSLPMPLDQEDNPLRTSLLPTPQVLQTMKCERCNITTTTVGAWEAHIHSRRHLKINRSSQENLST